MTGQSKAKPPKTIFAARLRTAQLEADISNRALAQTLDISESLLAKWKRGDGHPSFQNAERLARALDKPLDFFTAEPEEVAA